MLVGCATGLERPAPAKPPNRPSEREPDEAAAHPPRNGIEREVRARDCRYVRYPEEVAAENGAHDGTRHETAGNAAHEFRRDFFLLGKVGCAWRGY